MSDKQNPTIDEIIEGLKLASDWEYYGGFNDMPKKAMTTPEAKQYLIQLFEDTMKEILGDKLLDIAKYTSSKRQAGHTYTMLHGAMNTNALVIVGSKAQGRYSLGLPDNKTISLQSLERLKGHNVPLVVDHYALEQLVFEQRTKLTETIKGWNK